MSRVEREDPSERSNVERARETQRGRRDDASREEPNPGHTPTKAEGEEADVERALERQSE